MEFDLNFIELENWIEDNLMLHITKENNFSDSAYIVKTGHKYHLLWFTPVGEIGLCLDSSL